MRQARGSCASFVFGFVTFMSIGGFPSFVEDMKVSLLIFYPTAVAKFIKRGVINISSVIIFRFFKERG